jgi:hypothetical protein
MPKFGKTRILTVEERILKLLILNRYVNGDGMEELIEMVMTNVSEVDTVLLSGRLMNRLCFVMMI